MKFLNKWDLFKYSYFNKKIKVKYCFHIPPPQKKTKMKTTDTNFGSLKCETRYKNMEYYKKTFCSKALYLKILNQILLQLLRFDL